MTFEEEPNEAEGQQVFNVLSSPVTPHQYPSRPVQEAPLLPSPPVMLLVLRLHRARAVLCGSVPQGQGRCAFGLGASTGAGALALAGCVRLDGQALCYAAIKQRPPLARAQPL